MFLLRSCLVLLVDLHGELARRQQHQSVGLARGLAAQHFDDGDQEGERLAGSGLGGADYVFAFQGGGIACSWMGVKVMN